MKKIIALAACVILFAGSAFSQNYKNAVGLRIGYGVGVTYKHNLGGGAIEAMGWFNFKDSFTLAALYEWRTQVINKDFNLYYGAGAHIGAFGKDFALGIDGIVGLEYKVPTAPIAFSLDYKPAFNFIPNAHFDWTSFGLGIKYTF